MNFRYEKSNSVSFYGVYACMFLLIFLLVKLSSVPFFVYVSLDFPLSRHPKKSG